MRSSVLDYTKVLAWPIIALVVLGSFWVPLHEIGRMAPELVRQSTSIKIGSVSLELSKKVTRKVSDEVRNVLPKLDADDIKWVAMNDGGESTYGDEVSWKDDAGRIGKFATLGLVARMSTKDLEERQKINERPSRDFAGYKTTDLFDQVHAFLIDLVPEVISELQLNEPLNEKKKNER